jgi:ADP-ribose pyrophosphatase
MENTEKQLESQRIYEGKVVHLRLDTVLLPSGRTAKREVLEHRGAVSILPIMPDGQIAMIRQWRTAAQEILWEIPAGGLEENEPPEECAKRELIEEIGYKTDNLTLLFQCYLAPGYSSEMMWCYMAQDMELVGAQPEEDENIELIIKPLEELLPLIDQGIIRDSKTVGALLALYRLRQEQQGK